MTPQSLRDIHAPVALPGDWWWLWLLAGFVLVLLAVWGFRSVLRYFQPREPVAIPVPPWEKALAELARLEQTRPEGEAAVKHFYFCISGIIRLYIEERFNIRAPEMTTEEFMERVRIAPDLSDVQQEFLGQFLNISDMVKFARHEPSAFDRAEALTSARRFVEGSRVIVPADPDRGAA